MRHSPRPTQRRSPPSRSPDTTQASVIVPYKYFLPLLILLGSIAAYESVRGRAGWASRLVLAALALAAFYESSTIAAGMTDVSLSMVAYRWPALGWVFLVFLSASTVAVAEWLRLRGYWKWLSTFAAFAGGALAWHLITELV